MTPATKQSKLDTPVGDLTGVGPAYAKRLERLEIRTVEDLLRHFPRRYDDLRAVKTLADLSKFGQLPVGEPVTIRAAIVAVAARRARYGKTIVTAQVGSEQGTIEAVWFNQPYLAKQLKTGDEYIFAGKLKDSYGRLSLQNPTYEPVKAVQTHTARLVPVYPETEGLSSKWLRQKIKVALPAAQALADQLPEALRARHGLLEIREAIEQIHFPDTPEAAARARYRFDFEQILVMQLLTQRSRRSWRERAAAVRVPYDPAVTKAFVEKLPWPLTDEQRRAAHEILTDLESDQPMLRMLEGDVGSGKTAVAAVALNQAVAAGYQGALMAPTEVLARQHVATLSEWFSPFGIDVVALTGSLSAKEKQTAQDRIRSGYPLVVVGTHALIQEQIDWTNLALAIVDEQHRFGVEQREALKGERTPHLLSMTATPIPRSLALTAYGDQDLSAITTPPAGRTPVATSLVLPADRAKAFDEITRELAAGRQAFVIYPVIGGTKSGLKEAETEYERLASTVFAKFRVGLLHGRLPAAEKAAVMDRFARGELDVLVSTTVVEVGVDVPNATVMVIEEAQQFGLAQLHQLRGRVGRGKHPGKAYLLPAPASDEDNERLAALTTSQSGFELAEVDLKLRGPGDLLGTKQSGFDVSLAGLTDPELLQSARDAARDLLDKDPDLASAPGLRDRVAAAVLPA